MMRFLTSPFDERSLPIYKRDVQGVIVMRIEEGNKVVSLERVENLEEEEATE